jgi:hypothetical protein
VWLVTSKATLTSHKSQVAEHSHLHGARRTEHGARSTRSAARARARASERHGPWDKAKAGERRAESREQVERSAERPSWAGACRPRAAREPETETESRGATRNKPTDCLDKSRKYRPAGCGRGCQGPRASKADKCRKCRRPPPPGPILSFFFSPVRGSYILRF